MNISELVKKEEEYIVSLRRYFHAHPEASLKEYKTAAKIEEELKALGIPYERVGETGLIGYIGNPDKGKTIALRADIDALEIEEANDIEYKSVNKGLMHACGHDAHTASLLGAAKILKSKEAVLEGTFRTFSKESREKTQNSIERIVKSITQAHGGKAEIEFKAFANPVINDEASSLFAAKIAKNIVGEDNVITNQEKALGADDFADFQAVVPGVYAHIGSRDPQDKGTHYPHHNERFNIDEKCLLVATNFYIQYALEYLNKSN